MAFPNRFEQFVSIPVKSSGDNNVAECIDICQSALPAADDVITLLRDECATVDLWHRVGLLYYHTGDCISFLRITSEGYRLKQSEHRIDCRESSVVPLLLSTGAYFYKMACKEDDKLKREKFLNKIANCYNRAESLGVKGFEAEYYVGRAYTYLLTGEHDHAEKHFVFILSTLNPTFIPAIVGKALIAFGKKDYTSALQSYRQALQLDPYGQANVRVGIGHCFWKLNNREKALIAYERAVELYPDDCDALCALATYHLSTMEPDKIVVGVQLLARAHSICPTHHATQLYLADHYYYKKELDKSVNLALEVCKNTGVDEIRKRSAYVAGRCYQAKGEYKVAMHHYYQAISEPYSGFLLPYFGLAVCYLHEKDNPNSIKHCTDTLVKMLLYEPNNYFAMKMLGCMECTSEDPMKRARAQKDLKAALEQDPDDLCTKLSLATSLGFVDDAQARDQYCQVLAIMASKNLAVAPEVHNNLACTLFRLKDYKKALKHFELALELVTLYVENGTETNYRPLLITLNFNRARTKEALHEYGVAETIYKEILRKHPSYFSCFIRLAVIYRDRNNLHEADVYFKEALQCSLEHPDVWAYIGNLHLAQGETLPAQKKFQRILKMNDSLKSDSYSMIALGNVDMKKVFNCLYDANTTVDSQMVSFRNYMNQSLKYFQEVLEREPNNIWAANGVGCLFAAKGLFTDAREIFSQVRETTKDFQDVWINIANTYLEQGLYFNAIQMYERCDNRFSINTDCNLLQCLAKAYFHNKQFREAKTVLLKCLRVAPFDKNIIFSLAKTLRKIGWQPFQVQSAGSTQMESTLEGLNTLRQAKKFFERLSNKQSNTSSIIAAAEIEAQHCDDLIRQTPHMLSRIEADFQREQSLKDKREREVRAFKEKQRKEQVLYNQRKRQVEQESQKVLEAVKRRVEKVKQTLEQETINETKKKERKVKKDKDEIIDNSFIDDEDYCPETSFKTVTAPTVKKVPRKKLSRDIAAVDEPSTSSPPQNKRKRPTKSQRKTYSRIKVVNISDSDDDSIPVETPKKQPPKLRELSPDITDLPYRRITTSVTAETTLEIDKIKSEKQLEESYEDYASVVAVGGEIMSSAEKKNTDDSILYLDIFSGTKNEPAKNDNDANCGETTEPEETTGDLSCMYDDLPPPKLILASEVSREHDDDDSDSDTLPPVLHSINSDPDEN